MCRLRKIVVLKLNKIQNNQRCSQIKKENKANFLNKTILQNKLIMKLITKKEKFQKIKINNQIILFNNRINYKDIKDQMNK